MTHWGSSSKPDSRQLTKVHFTFILEFSWDNLPYSSQGGLVKISKGLQTGCCFLELYKATTSTNVRPVRNCLVAVWHLLASRFCCDVVFLNGFFFGLLFSSGRASNTPPRKSPHIFLSEFGDTATLIFRQNANHHKFILVMGET